MATTAIHGGVSMPEVKRVKVSEKRQITIPKKFFDQLNIKDEVEVFVKNGELIVRPAGRADHGFAAEILKDLILQGYQGLELYQEFVRIQSQIRPAVEEMIAEADEIAREALKSGDNKNKTAEIFADLDD